MTTPGGNTVKVRLGWSGEVESNVWRKADVTLDETDLERMLRQADMDPSVADRLNNTIAHMLLDNAGEILLTRKLMQLGYPAEAGTERINTLEARNEALLDELKSRLTVPA